MKKTIAFAAIAALLLAGCGSAKTAAPAAHTSTTAPSPSRSSDMTTGGIDAQRAAQVCEARAMDAAQKAGGTWDGQPFHTPNQNGIDSGRKSYWMGYGGTETTKTGAKIAYTITCNVSGTPSNPKIDVWSMETQ